MNQRYSFPACLSSLLKDSYHFSPRSRRRGDRRWLLPSPKGTLAGFTEYIFVRLLGAHLTRAYCRFRDFWVAALRMTFREATILWALSGFGVATISSSLKTPIAVPMGTTPEWFAGALSFFMTIGQCAYVGFFENSMRRTLHQRTVELTIAYQRIEELAQSDE